MTAFQTGAARDRMRAALSAVAAGRPVVVVDDADGENEGGELIFAAARATPDLVAFTVRHTSGFICVALRDTDCVRLDLPPMHQGDGDRYRTAYRVTVDSRGAGTGISATDRAATIAALASPWSAAGDFVRPGHVVPLGARPGGVLTRPGRTEAAVDLVRLAGQLPAGALCGIVSAGHLGEMARGAELQRFAEEHDLAMISIADLVHYRRSTEPQARRVASAPLPTEHGYFTAVGYAGTDGAEHLALVAGAPESVAGDTPVHVHTQCVSGDVLRSTACTCGRELSAAMARFSASGGGIVVYLRPADAVRACALRDDPLGADRARDLELTAEWILTDLGAHPPPSTGNEPARLDQWVAARHTNDNRPQRIAG